MKTIFCLIKKSALKKVKTFTPKLPNAKILGHKREFTPLL